MKQLGVIVARFQVPSLHEGHLKLINDSAKNSHTLVIFLGHKVHQPGIKNPYSLTVRKEMLQQALAQENLTCTVIIDAIEDHPISNELWSEELDSKIDAYKKKLEDETKDRINVLLFGSRDSFVKSYFGKHQSTIVEEEVKISGTEMRKKVLALTERDLTREHREGIMYGLKYVYPVGMSVVDVVIYKREKGEMSFLLGRKAREDVYRTIGGFFDVEKDSSLEDSALRELREEVGDIIVGAPTYLMSVKIDDWRYRDNEHKIVSSLFIVEYISGSLTPQDDIKEVKWFSDNDLQHGAIYDGHKVFFKSAQKYLKTLGQ